MGSRRRQFCVVALVCLMASILATYAVAQVSRVSLTNPGGQSSGGNSSIGNQVDAQRIVSDDGRFVVFESLATNLVANDSNTYAQVCPGNPPRITNIPASDIFLRDRTLGTTARVSVDSSGNQANSRSRRPAMSANGNFIVYQSEASNLVSGDTNGQQDIFLYDSSTGTTTRVSVVLGGPEANGSNAVASVSANGKQVVWESDATNFLGFVGGTPVDNNAVKDIYAYNGLTGVIKRMSVSSSGAQANGGSRSAAISKNGRFVAFRSNASNLVSGDTNGAFDVFLHDRDTTGGSNYDQPGTISTVRISVSTAGNEADGPSHQPYVSDNGRFIAFESQATNLIDNQTINPNQYRLIYVRDMLNGTTSLLRIRPTDGALPDGHCADACISNNGRYVAFHSVATSLIEGYIETVTCVTPFYDPCTSAPSPTPCLDVYFHDRDVSGDGTFDQTGDTSTIRLSLLNQEGNGASFYPSMSADGCYVVFESMASDLIGQGVDTNNLEDVFIWTRSCE